MKRYIIRYQEKPNLPIQQYTIENVESRVDAKLKFLEESENRILFNILDCIEVIYEETDGYRFKYLNGGYDDISLNERDNNLNVQICLCSSRNGKNNYLIPKVVSDLFINRYSNDIEIEADARNQINTFKNNIRKNLNVLMKQFDEDVKRIIDVEVEELINKNKEF